MLPVQGGVVQGGMLNGGGGGVAGGLAQAGATAGGMIASNVVQGGMMNGGGGGVAGGLAQAGATTGSMIASSGAMGARTGGTGPCGMGCGPGGGVGCGPGGGVGCGPGGGNGCGGVGSGCGGGYDETGVLSYVGPGQGEYRAETIYTYVGKGAGDVEMVMVPTKIGSNWCYCIAITLLTLLLLWLLMPFLSSDTTTTTIFVPPTTPAPLPPTTTKPTTTKPALLPVKSCSIFGDPHAMTFDGTRADYYTAGEFWIVKSTNIFIQGRYAPTHATNGLAVTKEIAIGGPFLKGNTLIIGEESASWNGEAILVTFPGEFKDPSGLVTIEYNAQGELLQPGREGKSLHVLHITLPGQVSIQVNRWNEVGEGRYINSKITMPTQPGGQDGNCGNYNGNGLDDTRMSVVGRLGKDGVAVGDLLFPGAKTTINQDLEDCDDAALVSAHETCKKYSNSFWPKRECLVTVCQGGKPSGQPVVA